MRNSLPLVCLTVVFVCHTGLLSAAEWVSDPWYYTHSPNTGTRVTQYAAIGPFFVQPSPNYVESGYHHERSSIRVGDSSDNYVRTTRWGEPVRPYGEWQFPYRPNSVPYDMWGPPFPQLGYAPYHGCRPGPGAAFGFAEGPRLPYAQPLADDTWFDRRTQPQGYPPRVDRHDRHFFHRRDEPLRDPLPDEMRRPPEDVSEE